jgi:hypothetical protein
MTTELLTAVSNSNSSISFVTLGSDYGRELECFDLLHSCNTRLVAKVYSLLLQAHARTNTHTHTHTNTHKQAYVLRLLLSPLLVLPNESHRWGFSIFSALVRIGWQISYNQLIATIVVLRNSLHEPSSKHTCFIADRSFPWKHASLASPYSVTEAIFYYYYLLISRLLQRSCFACYTMKRIL